MDDSTINLVGAVAFTMLLLVAYGGVRVYGWLVRNMGGSDEGKCNAE